MPRGLDSGGPGQARLGVLLDVCIRRGIGLETETNFKLLDGMEVNYVSLTNGH